MFRRDFIISDFMVSVLFEFFFRNRVNDGVIIKRVISAY